jgi:hypothetical protein
MTPLKHPQIFNQSILGKTQVKSGNRIERVPDRQLFSLPSRNDITDNSKNIDGPFEGGKVYDKKARISTRPSTRPPSQG